MERDIEIACKGECFKYFYVDIFMLIIISASRYGTWMKGR